MQMWERSIAAWVCPPLVHHDFLNVSDRDSQFTLRHGVASLDL